MNWLVIDDNWVRELQLHTSWELPAWVCTLTAHVHWCIVGWLWECQTRMLILLLLNKVLSINSATIMCLVSVCENRKFKEQLNLKKLHLNLYHFRLWRSKARSNQEQAVWRNGSNASTVSWHGGYSRASWFAAHIL